ncbi:hypothetical protein AB2B38_003435 [Balneola sp. MJW-20]|uniref:hypothetical protein n=1 Tax=Gracilimonas aurantiaca TaxID=3234185 RepID=UPI0034664875
MIKLTPSQIKILERLIFPETFDVIQEETDLQYGEIRDDLINLMNYRLIDVVDRSKPEPATTNFYDADNLKESSFQLTKLGIKHIKQRRR